MKGEGRPVSRVLSRVVISLGPPSPTDSSGLPGAYPPEAERSGPLPSRPCLALLRVGVATLQVALQSRGLLPHGFTLACVRLMRTIGCLVSVALSVALRRPPVRWHPALWSPDFPPPLLRRRPPGLPSRV